MLSMHNQINWLCNRLLWHQDQVAIILGGPAQKSSFMKLPPPTEKLLSLLVPPKTHFFFNKQNSIIYKKLR